MPETGRTHQLRVHCDVLGTPILGDGKYGGEEAFIDGVVDFLSPDGEVLETAIDLATELMENAPLALRASKEAISKGMGISLESGLKVEKEAYSITLNSEDRIEALKLFTLKQPPKWSGK